MRHQGEYVPSTRDWVREQVATYEATGGVEANTLRGNPDWPVVIVTMRGAKTGAMRKTPVMRVEKDGNYAMVASQGGAPVHPHWYFNIIHHPEVTLQDGAEPRRFRARLVQGVERTEWWQRAVEQYAPYAEYQTLTERQIPVFVLEPSCP